MVRYGAISAAFVHKTCAFDALRLLLGLCRRALAALPVVSIMRFGGLIMRKNKSIRALREFGPTSP
jgi:hypothetical protein